jgi:hypothetical protein
LDINGTYLRFVSDELRGDQYIASVAIQETYKAFGYISEDLKSNEEWVQSILSDYVLEISNYAIRLEQESWGIQKVPELFRYNKELCAVGLSNRGISLEFTPVHIREDAKLVELAVRQNGLALEFAGEKLKSDTRLVEAALKQNGRAVRYVSSVLLDDERYRDRLTRKYPSSQSVLREMGYE